VEIISSASLNNDDIQLLLEYMGTSGSSVASFVNSLPTVLTAGSALPSSSNSWTALTVYSTWNPADTQIYTLSNGNLTITGASGNGGSRSTFNASTGKYYWEITMNTWVSSSDGPGIMLTTASFGNAAQPGGCAVTLSGQFWVNGSTAGSMGVGFSSGNTVGIAVDFTNKLIWFRLTPSGNWNGSGTANPATGTGGVSFSTLSGNFAAWISNLTNAPEVATANFGASTFSGAVPSGFAAGLQLTPTNKQLLQVSFTPAVAGRVRGLIKLGKPSTTVWCDPRITVT
jgi:hypothetical protein